MTKIFVTMLTFNSSQATMECLESMEGLNKLNFEIDVIVVDNASKEKFTTNKKYKNFKLEIIRSEQNTGFSGGQNLGITHALKNGADYIVILNNDTIVDQNLIVDLLSSFTNDVGIIAPKIYFAKGFEFHKDRYAEDEKGSVIWYAGGIIDWDNVIGRHNGVDEVDKGQFDVPTETDYATGCCQMVKREVFEKAGFLDDKFFLYYEDADFSLRVKKLGYKVMFEPKAKLWHKNAVSAGGSGSSLQDYYVTRNRLLFGFRYASIRTKFALVRESLRTLLGKSKWQKIGVRDFYLGKFGKGSY
jgi:GT2 family glycosyltransferase